MDRKELLQLLDERGISYEYAAHAPVTEIEDMANVELPHPKSIAKNLFVRDNKKWRYYLIAVRADQHIDLQSFAKRNGTRRLSFASEEDLASILGLAKGCVTPFGLLSDSQHRVELFIDPNFQNDIIGIHPLDNSATVWLKTEDLLSLLRDAGCDIEWIAS